MHKLWNSGRAGPRDCSPATVHRPAAAEGDAADAAAAEVEAGSSSLESEAGSSSLEVEAGSNSPDEAKLCRPADPQSLGSAVASVADLPEEVLRRLVSYCTL